MPSRFVGNGGIGEVVGATFTVVVVDCVVVVEVLVVEVELSTFTLGLGSAAAFGVANNKDRPATGTIDQPTILEITKYTWNLHLG